jgi:hypothetical protein
MSSDLLHSRFVACFSVLTYDVGRYLQSHIMKCTGDTFVRQSTDCSNCAFITHSNDVHFSAQLQCLIDSLVFSGRDIVS